MKNKNMSKYAVVDKIAGGYATLLVGKDEKEMIVNLDDLPDGVEEGAWLDMDGDGAFAEAPGLTMERKTTVRAKLDRLRKKKNSE